MKGTGQKDSSGSFKDLPMVKVGVILTSKWIIMMDFKPLNVIKNTWVYTKNITKWGNATWKKSLVGQWNPKKHSNPELQPELNIFKRALLIKLYFCCKILSFASLSKFICFVLLKA